jgi:hypothetical protein
MLDRYCPLVQYRVSLARGLAAHPNPEQFGRRRSMAALALGKHPWLPATGRGVPAYRSSQSTPPPLQVSSVFAALMLRTLAKRPSMFPTGTLVLVLRLLYLCQLLLEISHGLRPEQRRRDTVEHARKEAVMYAPVGPRPQAAILMNGVAPGSTAATALNTPKASRALCVPVETAVCGAVSDASTTYTTSGFAALIASATLSASPLQFLGRGLEPL